MPMSSPGSSRDLVVTGWIGEHPRDGSDVAHLLVCPRSPAISEGIPLVADTLGLVPAGSGPLATVPRETARIVLGAAGVQLLFGSGEALSYPGDEAWKRAATRHGFMIVTCGTDPFGGDLDQLEEYLARPDGLYMGMVMLAEPGDTATVVPDAITLSVVDGGIAALATAMPVTEEDMARKAQLSGPVQKFFRVHADPHRSYSMADIGAVTGIGPQDAVPLMHCLNMLVEIGVLAQGPAAGGAGPTWRLK